VLVGGLLGRLIVISKKVRPTGWGWGVGRTKALLVTP
jgi:hypothetical protein